MNQPTSPDPETIHPIKQPTESVWDYPRPPRLEPTPRHIRILHAGVVLADSHRALRILETSHPPVYYLSPFDVNLPALRRSTRRTSFCEFKGNATYWNLELQLYGGKIIKAPEVAWSYDRPTPPYEALANHLAFYASRVDECWVDDERVIPQPGDFYGGWITSDLRGPFKGTPGTSGW